MENKKKVIVFGLGQVYRTFRNLIDSDKADIIALSDNDPALHNTILDGKSVIKPDEITRLDYDYIIITSSYYESIKNQLKEMGIKVNNILNFFEIYKRINENDNKIISLLKCAVPIDIKYELFMQKDETLFQEKNLFLSAKRFISEVSNKKIKSLEEAEFQVYSQFGEDGIIQWLIHNVEIKEKVFIEFGVEDYTESNTRFLLMNNNWTGFVMDGSKDNINSLKNWKFFWKYDLLAEAAFITKENINSLITDAGFCGDIGILSIDLDGNDYWILNTIECVRPRILICEYNSIYGDEEAVCVPYEADFQRTKKHYSNLYWGASIRAYCDWAERSGYYYMGSNSAGNNAFFVRKDCISADKVPVNANVFTSSKYRESRDREGNLTYLRGRERLECIKEMELFNLRTNCIDTIANIYQV